MPAKMPTTVWPSSPFLTVRSKSALPEDRAYNVTHFPRKSCRPRAITRRAMCWQGATKPQRGDIFVEFAARMESSSVRSEICRPDGASDIYAVGFYKDFAPDGAEKKTAGLRRP